VTPGRASPRRVERASEYSPSGSNRQPKRRYSLPHRQQPKKHPADSARFLSQWFRNPALSARSRPPAALAKTMATTSISRARADRRTCPAPPGHQGAAGARIPRIVCCWSSTRRDSAACWPTLSRRQNRARRRLWLKATLPVTSMESATVISSCVVESSERDRVELLHQRST